MAIQPAEKKAIVVVTSLYLVRMLGLFSVLPVLSIYGLELLGANLFLLGLALGLYGLTQAIFQIPFGWASDRFGRKPVLLAGFTVFALGSCICAMASSIEWLLIGRAIQGAGAVSSVLLALLADTTKPEHRTIAMAIIGISIGLSFGLSVVVGPLIADSFSLQGVFVFSLILGLIALALCLFSVKEPEKQKMTVNPSIKSVLFDTDLARLNFSIFTLHFLQMCIWVAVPGILLTELGFSVDKHWMIYLIAVGGGFILMAPFMRRWDKLGKTYLSILVAIGAVFVATLSMSQVSGYHFFLLGLVLFFWGFNLLEATLPSTLTKLVSPGAKGTASGIYSTCQFIGVFLGGVAGGWVVQNIGTVFVFYVAAGFCLLWLLVMSARKLNLAA